MWTLTVVLQMVIAAARVASTYRVFSQTVDEPIHVASGLVPPTTNVGFSRAL